MSFALGVYSSDGILQEQAAVTWADYTGILGWGQDVVNHAGGVFLNASFPVFKQMSRMQNSSKGFPCNIILLLFWTSFVLWFCIMLVTLAVFNGIDF